MRRSSSVKRSVSRHTRNLLRQYAQDGRLKRSVPQREVRNAVVDMTSEERGLYDDIDEFVRQCYQGRSNLNRQGLGFVMTHFRLRLGSSRYAFLRSLEDLQQRATHQQAEELQWMETPEANEDEYSDFDPDTSPPLPEQSSESQRTLSSMLERCRSQTGPDSKFTSLLTQLERLRAEGFGKVMVFSPVPGHPNLVARATGTRRWGPADCRVVGRRRLAIPEDGGHFFALYQGRSCTGIQGTTRRHSALHRNRCRVFELPILFRPYQLRYTLEPNAFGTAHRKDRPHRAAKSDHTDSSPLLSGHGRVRCLLGHGRAHPGISGQCWHVTADLGSQSRKRNP